MIPKIKKENSVPLVPILQHRSPVLMWARQQS
jgi:hypothetical protein